MTVRRTNRHSRTCPVLLAIFLLILSVQWVTATYEHDPYKILGVSRSASQAEIKRAYKNLAREWWVADTGHQPRSIYITWHLHWCLSPLNPSLTSVLNTIDLFEHRSDLWCHVCFFRHPDKNKDPTAEDMFIKISKSYEVGENASQHVLKLTPLTDTMFHFLYKDPCLVIWNISCAVFSHLSSVPFTKILSNEERRSNFDRYGQTDENQPFGQSQHHGFRSFHNSFYFDESFFQFPRYPDCLTQFLIVHKYLFPPCKIPLFLHGNKSNDSPRSQNSPGCSFSDWCYWCTVTWISFLTCFLCISQNKQFKKRWTFKWKFWGF